MPMTQVRSKSHRRRILSLPEGYIYDLLALGPIAYWPLNELTGTAAACQVNASQNGTYTGVTLNSTTGPDGDAAGLWDGTNDYCDVYSAALDAAFNGALGSLVAWFHVEDLAVLTDGTWRNVTEIGADTNNRILIGRTSAAYQLRLGYVAGAAYKTVDKNMGASVAWHHAAITWSKAADQAKYYYDGTQTGSTLTGLGTWSGSLSSSNCTIGARSTVPNNPWKGYLAHLALFDKVLTDDEILALATV